MDPQHSAPVALWFGERIYWVFLGVMILNIIQRKHHQRAQKKRMATLIVGLALFGLLVITQSINQFGGSDWMFYLAVAAFVFGLYVYRDKAFPFRFRSPVDGRWLQFSEIFFDDNHGDGDVVSVQHPAAEDATDETTDASENASTDDEEENENGNENDGTAKR